MGGIFDYLSYFIGRWYSGPAENVIPSVFELVGSDSLTTALEGIGDPITSIRGNP